MYELRHSSLIIVANRKQEILYASDNSLSILGYTSKEMLELKLTDLMDERKARVHQYHIDNYSEKGAIREDVGRFMAIRKDKKEVEVNVWIPGKYAFEIMGETLIVGALWDAKVIDSFNSLNSQQKAMNQKIESISSELLDGIDDIKDIILKGLGYKKAVDEQKDRSINIINQGGKASQDTNVDGDFNGDITGGNKNTGK